MTTPARHSEYPLDRAFPALAEALPRVALGAWPTPVTASPQFANAHGLSSLHVKREDQSHPQCGGNKVRGLELLLGDAVSRGANTIITMGAAGSHHVCRTAWHAAQLGLRTVAALVPQAEAEYARRNLLCAASVGAELKLVTYVGVAPTLICEMLRPRNWHGAEPPYFIPPGGTSPRSCVGHVNAMFELRDQIDAGVLPEPDFLYVPMGSLGTAAGLLLGARLAGLKTRIIGVAVSYKWYCTAGRCVRMAMRCLRFMRRFNSSIPEVDLGTGDVEIVHSVLGEGYAQFTEKSVALAGELHRLDGVGLDGTYTAKALAGMMDFIREHDLATRRNLFWHTYHPLPPSMCAPGARNSLPPALAQYVEAEVQPLDKQLHYPRE
ncbi:D-cysteine desulfhydrase [Phycisphaerae bacterium RAS2]|nr:D-cysteine desulfhydrase [Phycisphaerae bacterium RAS2]